MPAQTLLTVFPKAEDLLATPAEDLGAILIELIPPIMQNGLFNPSALIAQLYQAVGPSYPPGTHRAVIRVLTEAIAWLVNVGLLAPDMEQPGPGFFILTRRAQALTTRADVEAYRQGRMLPEDLLTPLFREKVLPLFRRGDHDIAVFQAFKEVEVAVRKTANRKGAGYLDSEIGVTLMRKAFHPDTGPLGDQSVIAAEREAEMHLFAGAIGHAKNPAGHRDVVIPTRDAAQLILFAAYLLERVERRV